ncbi:hypothetical protein LNKW23_07590 [Paralimibaculum aggregatum]|uniref:Glycoside hydrolase n=1 Tax=Paralimibaculum aggregatum TaxID=3036245 RepID=A0ABQ6LM87_9RHOB|nr:sialidase family protein [Limibaculum sp. NKW23]GMG81546.1 hypothetical protein LNKW23_07590 [Limibaculum sp. NKW23]
MTTDATQPAGAVTLLVGTTKGLFLLRSDGDPEHWRTSGPLCGGWPINHAIGCPETGALWAAGGGDFHGAGIWRSGDGGETWELAKLANGEMDAWVEANPEEAAQYGFAPVPPAPYTGDVKAIWSLGRGPAAHGSAAHGSARLYAGAKPATLLASDDGGASWSRLDALTSHPSADGWQPGAAGLTLHSIVTHPEDGQKLWVGISAAGVFASEDGGQSWERRNRRSNIGGDGAGSGGETEVFLCVHNLVRAGAAAGDLLYQQNHQGVFRSHDGGRSWDEITPGLPSSFGFPVAVHPEDPQRIFVIPLNGDTQGRYPPEAAAAVWTSGDGGASWEALREGLPQENCYFTVLRQAMATDGGDPAGLYFGTNTGSVFARRGADAPWREIARHLPTVLSVETLARA